MTGPLPRHRANIIVTVPRGMQEQLQLWLATFGLTLQHDEDLTGPGGEQWWAIRPAPAFPGDESWPHSIYEDRT